MSACHTSHKSLSTSVLWGHQPAISAVDSVLYVYDFESIDVITIFVFSEHSGLALPLAYSIVEYTVGPFATSASTVTRCSCLQRSSLCHRLRGSFSEL